MKAAGPGSRRGLGGKGEGGQGAPEQVTPLSLPPAGGEERQPFIDLSQDQLCVAGDDFGIVVDQACTQGLVVRGHGQHGHCQRRQQKRTLHERILA